MITLTCVFPVPSSDHEPYDETHNGSRIVKVGYDAINTGIIDIRWMIDQHGVVADKPMVEFEIIPTESYPKDAQLLACVAAHEKVIKELEKAKVFRFEDWMERIDAAGAPFSTESNRLGSSTGSQVLCSVMRMAMRASVAIMNAGCIRGGKVYPKDQEWFTWSDLKAEIPFSTVMVALEVPGRVIEAMITESREGAKMDPPVARGGYLHHCDQVVYNNETCRIETIRGAPFDPDKLYMTAMPGQFFEGIDNHVPLLEWAKDKDICIDEECGKPAKLAVVEMFAALMWLELGSFADIDTDGDGVLTRAEVEARVIEIFGVEIAELVVESIMSVADITGNGTITPIEMMVVRFVATDMVDHVASHEELEAMTHVAAQVLNRRPSHIEVKRVVKDLHELIDTDGSGRITRDEAIKVLGEVRRRSLLV
jgi:Ca2+-binding EF-hand superfamily protein